MHDYASYLAFARSGPIAALLERTGRCYLSLADTQSLRYPFNVTSLSVARHRTAIKRSDLSRPIRIARDDGLINPAVSVFDYGCWHGDDIGRLAGLGIHCQGWDPVYRPSGDRIPADVLNLGYVINVIQGENSTSAANGFDEDNANLGLCAEG